MAWPTTSRLEWPPVPGDGLTLGTEISAWDFIKHLWRACAERQAALDDARWPRPYSIYDSGTVTGFTDNGDGTFAVEDSTKDWLGPRIPGDGPATKWWVGYSHDDLPYLPTNYDLIIETNGPKDHEKIIHVPILDNGDTTLKVPTWIDAVTAGWLASISAGVVGARYFIIKSGGWWHHERWPLFPNSQESLKGTCTGDTVIIDSVTYSRVQFTAPWRVQDLIGKDLVVWAGDGRMKRVQIVGNDAAAIWFAHQAWTAVGKFCVVAHGAKAWAGRTDDRWGIFQWYAGHFDGVFSHHPTDTLQAAHVPATSIRFAEAFTEIEPCVLSNHNAFDIDVWSEQANFCSPHEYNFTRYFYATLRGVQIFLESVAGFWILKRSDGYEGQACIPNSTFATLLHQAGVNAGSSAIAGPDGSGNYYFTVDPSLAGKDVYWTIMGKSVLIGEVWVEKPCFRDSGGTAVGADGKVILGSGETFGSTYGGKAVQWTLGWTRYYPRMAQRMFYPSGTGFIPDTGGEGAVDPPVVLDFVESGSTGVGQWVSKEDDLSTSYIKFSQLGKPEGYAAFQAGDYARYVGDNFSDGTANTTQMAYDTPYYDHFFVGQRSHEHKIIWDASKSGYASSGTVNSITDTDKHWWASNWYDGGTLRTETGTATSGSTTTLGDTAKGSGAPACFWDAARFNNFTSPWAGFILEVDKTVEEVTTTYKTPIVSTSGTTLTFLAVAGLTVEAGDVYRIKEPKYHLNQWKGRTVIITRSDGSTIEKIITHNDDQTLWFEEETGVIEAGWTYSIVEIEVGGVWEYDGSDWIKPVGEDPRGTHGEVFRDNQACNFPTKVLDYGKVRRGDYITVELLTEFYKVLNQMVWTRKSVAWRARENPLIPEENNLLRFPIFKFFDAAYKDARSWAEVQSDAIADYDVTYGGPTAIESTGNPRAYYDAYTNWYQQWTIDDGGYMEASCEVQYDYGFVDGIPTSMMSSLTIMVFGAINASDSEPVSETTHPDPNQWSTTDIKFDPGGTPLEFHKWKSIYTELSYLPSRHGKLGDSFSIPKVSEYTWHKRPIEEVDYAEMDNWYEASGWYALDAAGILKWDVPGGMEYVAP